MNVCRISLVCGDQLLDRAQRWKEERALVDHDEFRWYKAHGCLTYQESVIVNLRASSLRRVYQRRQRDILGLNLRYYVKRNTMHKEVDNGIARTIKDFSDKFWYLNNGIMVICRDFSLNKNGTLDLYDYSIVNGGQTTYNINEYCKKNDFPVVCKIVRLPDIAKRRGEKFAQEVAISANSQKPIRRASLFANNAEQRRLGAELEELGVFYIRKEGDKPGAKEYEYKESIEDIGKLGLAGILLMPMEARNMIQRMFDDPYRELIFRRENARLLRDLVVIRNAYIKFRKKFPKTRRPNWCRDRDERNIATHGLTFVISSIAFCIRRITRNIGWRALNAAKDAEEYAKVSGNLERLECFLSDEMITNADDFAELFCKLVHIIYDAYKKSSRGRRYEETYDAFLKRGDAFLEDIAPRLMRQCRVARFRKLIMGLTGS